jgi:hypothetical protein
MANSRLTWVKSSYSGSQGGNCVEIAADRKGGVLIRDTKNRAGSVLGFGQGAWLRFAAEVKAGRRTRLGPGSEVIRGRPLGRGRPLRVGPLLALLARMSSYLVVWMPRLMVFSGAEDSIRMELVSRLDIGADRRVLFHTGL